MKKMRKAALILTVWAVMATAAGCQRKYEPIDLEPWAGQEEDGMETVGAAGEEAVGGESRDAEKDGKIPEGSGTAEAHTSSRDPFLVGETAPAMEERDETVYVAGSDVNVRAAAGTSSQIMAVLQRGDRLRRTGYEDTWSRVEYQGMTCYIASRYVSLQEPKTEETASPGQQTAGGAAISLDPSWKYAEFSRINSGSATLYKAADGSRKGITVCVNAGHGTKGGSGVKTLCHPDGTPKVTGGTTGAGATSAVAVSGGMTFSDGTAEARVTLAMALKLKERLLEAGYDVVMIRESDDVQLDNIARTVIANNRADCHVALHWDSTTSDKGAFYMSVPNVSSYRAMEPVKSNWEKHNRLGECLVAGLKDAGVKIFSGGAMEMDLTQTSYSTVPSVDIELGDKASDHSGAVLDQLAGGLVAGIDRYFGQ